MIMTFDGLKPKDFKEFKRFIRHRINDEWNQIPFHPALGAVTPRALLRTPGVGWGTLYALWLLAEETAEEMSVIVTTREKPTTTFCDEDS